MKVSIDYKEGILAIDEMLKCLPAKLQDQEKMVLKKVGTVIKKNVLRYMRESDVEERAKAVSPSNYDGSRPYVHMKDDVKSSVRKDKMGNQYVSVRGGKMTGFKWGMVNDGHISRDGSTFVPGNNFMGRAVSVSESEVDRLINDMLKKVADD